MSGLSPNATIDQHEEAWAKIHDLLAAGHWERAREIFDQAVSSTQTDEKGRPMTYWGGMSQSSLTPSATRRTILNEAAGVVALMAKDQREWEGHHKCESNGAADCLDAAAKALQDMAAADGK